KLGRVLINRDCSAIAGCRERHVPSDRRAPFRPPPRRWSPAWGHGRAFPGGIAARAGEVRAALPMFHGACGLRRRGPPTERISGAAILPPPESFRLVVICALSVALRT